jgi:dienelactone hydrolase
MTNRMRPKRTVLRLLCVVCALFLLHLPLPARAQACVERELFVPWDKALPNGLDAVLVYYDLPGKHPLAVLTHGSARDREKYAEVTPWQQLPQAIWFARRGWIVLAVVRRGYGASGGIPDTRSYGSGRSPNYWAAGHEAAEDLKRAIEYARGFPQVDNSHIMVAGVSSGGFAAVALTAEAPDGLVAGINFSGGRGSQAANDVRAPESLVTAFADYGARSRVPMLWLYSENDKFFWPELAKRFDAAFRSAGGQDQFTIMPPVGADGHALFRDIPVWSDTVDRFLAENHLVFVAKVLPEPPLPDVPPPPGLSTQGTKLFHEYLLAPPHKAFAMSPHYYGYSSGNISTDMARTKALGYCNQSSKGAESGIVVSIDNYAVSR